jgi:zinc protease
MGGVSVAGGTHILFCLFEYVALNAKRPGVLVAVILFVILAVGTTALALSSGQVRETILPNGLKVLTKEVHTAPVVSFNIWYKVGSRNEVPGKTGISHFLEHMQFKGTKAFKKGEIDRLIQRNGGLCNAATWRDFTYYWETISSDKLELAIRIEADRMVNSLLDEKEVSAEKSVVLSELDGYENDPEHLLYYELYATAFKKHSYRWPTIGRRQDVEGLTREDLYKYYKTYYVPNNATLVIVGDFDTKKALDLVRKYFGKIPKGPEPPKVLTQEPPQVGERRSVVKKPGIARHVMIGFHIPAVGHPDIYPLEVVEIILSEGTSSRLYKALVDKQLAIDVWANSTVSRDPDLFILGATASDGVGIGDVEKAILAEIEKLKNEPIGDEELQKAINQLEAQFIYANDSVTDQAHQLGLFETIYSWRFLEEYLPGIRRVTKADVQRVVNKYFTETNRTVVTFVPESEPTDQARLSNQFVGFAVDFPKYSESKCESTTFKARYSSSNFWTDCSTALHAKSNGSWAHAQTAVPLRTVFSNGLVVIIHENHANPTVAVYGSLNAGAILDPSGKNGLASLTADLLMKGTAKRSADQIAHEKDFNAVELDVKAGPEYVTVSGYSLSKRFELLLDLMSDILRNPVFPEEEFTKLKSLKLSSIRQEQDNPESLAFRAFYGSVFPKGHPYHRLSVEEELASVAAITRDDVIGFYKNHYGPHGAVIVIVGDVDSQEALAKAEKYFGDWIGGNPERPKIPEVSVQTTVKREVIPLLGKSQVVVILGHAGLLKRTDSDFYAAVVMNHILGGGGALGSRMGDLIRDDMGLVYTIYSTFDASFGAGPWYVQFGTSPQNLDKAISVVLDQIKVMHEKGATKKEVQEAIDFITGSFPARRLVRNSSIAETLHFAEIYGLGMDYLYRYKSLYESVTLDQVNAAAKKYLHPEAYTLVIVGPVKSTEGNLGANDAPAID